MPKILTVYLFWKNMAAFNMESLVFFGAQYKAT